MSSASSVLPSDLVSVEVAALQVGAPPSDLVDQVHVSGALSGACTGKGSQMANPRPTPKPGNLGPQTSLTRCTSPVLYPVLAPERGPEWQTHARRRNLGRVLRRACEIARDALWNYKRTGIRPPQFHDEPWTFPALQSLVGKPSPSSFAPKNVMRRAGWCMLAQCRSLEGCRSARRSHRPECSGATAITHKLQPILTRYDIAVLRWESVAAILIPFNPYTTPPPVAQSAEERRIRCAGSRPGQK